MTELRRAVSVATLGLLAVFFGNGCAAKVPRKPTAELLQNLNHPEERVRLSAAEQLGDVTGGDVAEAVRALTAALKDDSAYVRQAAVRSLGAHGTAARDAVAALQRALKDSDEGVRLDARAALKKIQGP